MVIDVDRRVVLLDPKTLQVVRTLDELGTDNEEVVLSHDGRLVAASSGGDFIVYDLTESKKVGRIDDFSAHRFLDDRRSLFGRTSTDRSGTIVEIAQTTLREKKLIQTAVSLSLSRIQNLSCLNKLKER